MVKFRRRKDRLSKTSDTQDTNYITIEKCTVFVLDKKLIPNQTFLGKEADDFFVQLGIIENEKIIVERKILDILPLNWKDFTPGTTMWFQQCECVDTNDNCDDVVA